MSVLKFSVLFIKMCWKNNWYYILQKTLNNVKICYISAD